MFRGSPTLSGRRTRIVFELVNRPFGWAFESIQQELDVSERTLLRYVAASREELVDWSEPSRRLFKGLVEAAGGKLGNSEIRKLGN